MFGEVGDRVRLIAMGHDPCPIEPGSEGVIDMVDGIETRHVRWDNGRRLGLVPRVDRWEVLKGEGND